MTTDKRTMLVFTVAVDRESGEVAPVGNLAGPGDMVRMLDAIEMVTASMRRQLHLVFSSAAGIEPSENDPDDPDET